MTRNNNKPLWAMLISLLAFVSVIRSEFSDRVAGPWFQYNFLRDECLAGEISPSSSSVYNWFGALDIANPDTIQCVNGTGITGHSINPTMERVISSGASGNELMDMVHNSATGGISFEIWFKPADDVPEDDENNVILAITFSDPDSAPANARNIIKIVENGNMYKVLFDFETEEVTNRFIDYAEKPASPHQFVYAINLHYVGTQGCLNLPTSAAVCQQHSAYINGALIWSRIWILINGSPTYSEQKIHLFSDPVNLPTYAPSSGTLYMMAVYGSELDAAEIQQNYAAKLLNSAPVAFNTKLIVPGDGVIGDNSDDYTEPIPGSKCFVIVIEDYVDADEDPDYVNYNAADNPATLLITSLPSKGDLFNLDGNLITEDDLPYAVSLDDDNSLRYRPLWNEYSGLDSMYTSFEYIYKDGVDPSLESNVGTAEIYVTAKQDPPIAVAGVSVVVRGVVSEVCVDAYDIDDGDSIAGILLVDEPQKGTLYQFDSSGTVDIEKPISSGDTFDKLFCAAYLYTGDDTIPTDGIMGFDTFTFKAYDTAAITGYSVEATTTLNVYEGLLAGNGSDSTSFNAVEDTVNTVTIYGSDAVQTARNISFVISTVPIYGVLVDANTETLIKSAGSALSTTLTSPYTGGVELQYLPLDNYFTVDLPDNFSYYVAATDDMDKRSKEVVVTLNVVNTNDPVELLCPESYYLAPSSEETVHEVTLDDFDIEDVDNNTDLVHVVITASYGTLTLNEEYLNSVDFASPDICFGQEKWRCQGSGSGDSTMSFVGYPKDILNAIDGMTYVGMETGKVDTVSFAVYDGMGDECISHLDQEDNSTVRTECFTSTCNVKVLISPQGISAGGDGGDGGDISAASTGFKITDFPLYAWFLIFGGLTMFCCYGLKRCCCGSRRAPPQQVQYLPPPPPPPQIVMTSPLPSPEQQIRKEFTPPAMVNTTKDHHQDHQLMKESNKNLDINFYDLPKTASNTPPPPTECCSSPSSADDTPLKKYHSNSYGA